MNPALKSRRLDFLNKPAPAGYVAGIGRGATGFTTRSDIGPAREAAAAAAAAALAANAASSSSSQAADDGPPKKLVKRNHHHHQQGKNTNADDEEEDLELYLNESNYDDFAGYGGSLVNKDPYEEDDEEADKIYEAIDRHVDERGKALREAKMRQELERYRQERPKIQQQFSDLKASLSQVSELEWMSIPDVGDARNRRQRVARQDKFTPVPDSLLAHQMKVASGGERVVYIDPKTADPNAAMDSDDEDESAATNQLAANSAGGGGVNIGEMSDLRSSYMSVQLSRRSNPAIDGQTTVDPKEYLTKYETLTPSQITDESTLKEFRKQYASLRNANPNLANVWIASVRLEEAAGKLSAARSLILEACKKCPKSVDLWLEAVRVHPPDTAQSLMVKAIKENPKSVRLWIRAADLEDDIHLKRRVFEKAREMVPKEALIWKKSVELEEPNEARRILREAIECCPESVELFLALARLEPYEQAQRVLIKASEKHPTERSIWIMAAKLEEAAGHEGLVESIIGTAIERIAASGSADQIKRDEWLAEAADADKARFKTTCHEIIKHVIGKGWPSGGGGGGDDDKRRLEIWFQDIGKFIEGGSLECARAVYELIVGDRSGRQVESNWISYAEFERKHGTSESFESVLKRAISGDNCSKSERLWLMLANERRKHLNETRQILSDALDANPDSELIILEAVELECENGNHKEARRILADACMSAKTPQLVRRAAQLEWNQGNLDEAIRMLKAGSDEYKHFADFYLMLGQIEEQRGNNESAKVYYSNGLKFNPTSVPLWISVANVEEKTGFMAKARSKLEMARLRNPKCPLLWLESARFEIRAHLSKKAQIRGAGAGSGNSSGGARPDIVATLLAKGIRECKDCADVDILRAEQEAFNKRKFA